ncbi:lipolytic enzyme [Rhodopseudomonas sp. B29]|uniref:lipolytic enzyme n=1 Tax=Rhodopseudomonas sp. B29 TaxID=95607 RepID=UPI0003472EDA|nr:lipolytic enzyme [Rhodopseudomonas sp. B29]
MRTGIAGLAAAITLGLCVVAGACWPASAEDGKDCEVPAYLLTTDLTLGKTAEALRTARKLDILVVGSRSSSIAPAEGTAYPQRLQAMLRDKLPGAEINVSVELRPKRTAADVAASLGQLVTDRKATLVIWQTGTFDAIRSIDPDEFHTALVDGIDAAKKAGADVILMNLQYSPRTETMINPAPYLDNMRVAGQEKDVPVFDRFAMMRLWNESGEFDLFSPSPGIDMAIRVHNCLARALSTFVINAARIGPTELRTQR